MKTLDRIKHGINAGELVLGKEQVTCGCSCCGDRKLCYIVFEHHQGSQLMSIRTKHRICFACAEDL